jgi:hypothetical protein
MNHRDKIYGEFEITEPVILELCESKPMQRLKSVRQHGYPEPFFTIKEYSRFEHSVGVYLLLKKYQAPIEEQIAGLIHDVSHAAFSHCIDYVLSAGSEKNHDHQDNIFESYVRKTEIPEIIKKHSFDLDYILADENFPLKEKKLPDLCADRLDYSFRDAVMFNLITVERAREFLDNLQVIDNQWVFTGFEIAKNYAELFFRLNNEDYAGLPSATMHRTVGDYLKYALEKKYISSDDLYSTDNEVLGKVAGFHEADEFLKLLFARMNNEISAKNDPNDYDARVFCKSRFVDPLFIEKEKIQRLSLVDRDWRNISENENQPKVYFLKFEK